MLTINDIMRIIQPLRIKLQTVVGRAKYVAVDNSGKTQRFRLQFISEEVVEKIERIQDYGVESVPPVEDSSEAVYLSVGGQRGLTFIVATQARALRPTGLVAGEVMLWSKYGQKIHLKADGSVLITPAPGKLVNVGDEGGNAVALDTIMNKFNNHTHPTAGTGPPSVPSAPNTFAAADFTTKVKAK